MGVRDTKETYAAYQRAWRRKNPESAKRSQEKSNQRWRDSPGYLPYLAAYRAKHRDKIRARKLFNNAIKRGDIQRQPCCVCAQPNAEGHHPDYAKPLDVLWFCKKHHEAHHHPADADT